MRTIRREPNSLNPMLDNDAYLSTLFARTNDSLANRLWDDFSVWEPKLARAWTRQLRMDVYVKGGHARAFAKRTKKTWSAAERKRLQVTRVQALDEERVCLAIRGVKTAYREKLKADFGAEIVPRWWFTVDFQGVEFRDGRPVTPGEQPLGRGAVPPPPTWGEMISQGKQYIEEAGWLVFFPGCSIFLTVTVYNLAGDGLRDALDPRLRQ